MATNISRRSLLVAGAAAGIASTTAWPAVAVTERAGRGIAFTHATVLDPASGRVLPDTTVLVRGDTIAEVGRQVRLDGATVVDLRGKYVVPGLADMHAHAQADGIDNGLYVANGVTTVREMAGSPKARDWRDRIEAGTLLGPRYTVGSRIIDGLPSIWDPKWTDVVQVGGPAAARAAVRGEIARGADFIKVYSRVSRDAYRALADEAHRHGVPFVGHCPDAVPLHEAAELGQTSIEHLFWTPFETSTRESWIRSEIQRIRLGLGDYAGWFAALHPLEWTAAHTYSPVKARRLHEKLARHAVRQVPTLAMHRGLDFARTIDMNDPRNKYLPADALETQKMARQELYLKDRAPSQDAEWAAMFDYRLRTVRRMYEAGVPLMTGTDTGTVAVWPGFSVHDELELFVAAGIPPMAALHASTAEPAAFLGTRTGRVAPGHAADLAILDADPLHDIRNTRKLSGVVVRGRYVDAAERLRILAEVEHTAATAPPQAAAAGCPCHAH
ncbi:amidohydrolase family protein [Amycolatopsis sp. CA-230715]|uniref:amidohydrolase family protein n=1 Tax=Amycolatopsis sp. CA-230715 TaxID=2745196 RepID=UPI001C034989|nr:amidohydrolase family protein [Amycolatopsis sp. CA-230715]QWF81170.1 Adenine deaminase [Amycolatopsis sp. CA-230715]